MRKNELILSLITDIFTNEKRELTFEEIYGYVSSSNVGKILFENYKKESAVESKIRTTIYEYCSDRYLATHKGKYLFYGTLPRNSKGQKIGLYSNLKV